MRLIIFYETIIKEGGNTKTKYNVMQ
jgi:hypothetical protein